jgi:hypothetical protein
MARADVYVGDGFDRDQGRVGEMVRPARLERATFWFVAKRSSLFPVKTEAVSNHCFNHLWLYPSTETGGLTGV